MTDATTSPDLTGDLPAPVVAVEDRATLAAVHELIGIAMPPFESFLDHSAALRDECERAGALTSERAALFEQYKEKLLADRGEYEEAIEKLILEQFTGVEVQALIQFHTSPTFKIVEKALALGTVVSNIGTIWRTRVLERCPEAWKMIMTDFVGELARRNLPETCEVATPDAPPDREGGGWEKVDAPKRAEEYEAPEG